MGFEYGVGELNGFDISVFPGVFKDGEGDASVGTRASSAFAGDTADEDEKPVSKRRGAFAFGDRCTEACSGGTIRVNWPTATKSHLLISIPIFHETYLVSQSPSTVHGG